MALEELAIDESAAEWLEQSRMLVVAGENEEAERYLDRVLAAQPMEADAYLLKGMIRAHAGDMEQAKEQFENVLKLNKNYGLAWFHLGNIESILGKSAEGIKDYNRALSVGYDTSEVHYHLGLIYEERGDYEEAIRCYNRAIAMDELKKEYWISKISLQLTAGKIEEALQVLKEYRMIAPEDFGGFHLEAAALTAAGRFAEADEVLAQAEKLFPEDSRLVVDRVRVLVSQGKAEEALAEITKAEDMALTAEQKSSLLIHKGNVLGLQDDLDGAIACYQEAAEPDEEGKVNTEALYYLMAVSSAMEDYEHLLSAAKKAESFAENDPYAVAAPYFIALAESRIAGSAQTEAYRKAARFYRTMTMKNNARVDGYLYRALCHKEMQEYDRALEMVDYVIRLQPEGKLYAMRGDILKVKGDLTGAQEAYRKARSLGEPVEV